MGFGDDRNKRGHDIALVESFLEHGYVVQLEPNSAPPKQYPANASFLDRYPDRQKRRITNRTELRLEHLTFEEAEQHIK